jgi:hypothetical protein
MAKAFFVSVIILLFGGVALLFAAQLGAVPAPVYSFLYELELSIPFVNSSVPPYLQKFEGNWQITLTPQNAETELGSCVVISGLLHVHDGVFSGVAGELGSSYPFIASTTPDGALSGTFGGTTLRMGNFAATLADGQGNGTWSDSYGCQGSAVLQKQDQIVDPVKGKIVSANNGAYMMRGGGQVALYPGLLLYAGDEIITGNGTALLGMGADFGTPISVPSQGTYTVSAN